MAGLLLDPSTVMEVDAAAGERFPGAAALFTTVVEEATGAVEWYSNYFVGRDHVHYMAKGDEVGGVVIVSVLMTSVASLGVQYRVIVWAVKAVVRKTVEAPRPLSFDEVLAAVDPGLAQWRKLFGRVGAEAARGAEAVSMLRKLENDEPRLRIKIGVLFAAEGQVDETAMYQNENGSAAFEEFLDVLGERVRLKGFEGYSAQLDTQHDGSGTHSVYRPDFAGYEVMFHVSTLLQNDPTDEQRIQRKRFIGNDIVMIVFMDGSTTYSIECMASQYTRVVLVVQPVDDPEIGPAYALSVGYMKGLRDFGPPVYSVYPRTEAFAETLLTKCINGEKATMASPEFVIRDRRTRKGYLELFHEAFADPKALRKKALKRDSDLGLIPVSTAELAATVAGASQAFELELVMDEFPHAIATVEALGSSLFFGTPDGLYTSVSGSLRCSKVINMPDIVHVVIVESIGAMLVATPKLVVSLALDAVVAGHEPPVAVVPARNPLFVDAATIGDTTYVAVVASDPGPSAAYSLVVFATTTHDDFVHLKSVSLRTRPASLALNSTLCGAILGLGLDFELCPFSNFFLLPICTLAAAPPLATLLLKVADAELPGPDRASLASDAVVSVLAPSSLLPSVPLGAFPLGATGDTLLCYDTFGVVVGADLAICKRRVFEWVAPPVHFFVASEDVLVVVHHTFSDVYSLRNGACLETHVVTSPSAYYCRGPELYLPSWVPATGQCSLFHLLPKPAPSFADGPLQRLNASSSSIPILARAPSASAIAIPGRDRADSSSLTSPVASMSPPSRSIVARRAALAGPPQRTRSASVFDSESMYAARSSAAPAPLNKSSSANSALTAALSKSQAKAARKAAKADAKAARKAAKADAKADAKSAKAKAKAKAKLTSPPSPSTADVARVRADSDRSRSRSPSGILVHTKAAPPGRASSSRRSDIRSRRRQLQQARRSSTSAASGTSAPRASRPSAPPPAPASSAHHATVNEDGAHDIDVESLAAQWDKRGVIM